MQILNEDDITQAVLEMNAQVKNQQLQSLMTSIDPDAVFGLPSSLIADWIEYPAGRTRDGRCSDVRFLTIDFDFVLNRAVLTLRKGTRTDKVATT